MKKTFNQIFMLRKQRIEGTQQGTIYVRMTVNNQRTEFSTQRHCDVDKWLPEKGKMNGKNEEARSLNAYLESVRLSVYEIFQEFMSSGEEFTVDMIRARYLGLDTQQVKTLLEVYEEHNIEFAKLIGKGLSYRTLQKYRTIKGYVAEFLTHQYRLSDIEITKVDYQFVRDFEVYLKSVKNCCHNTTMDYLKKIKKIMNLCIVKKWIDHSPFTGFRMPVAETNKTFLTEEELSAIENKVIAISRLGQVRDIFLFSCYTGLAYCDVFKLRKENLVTGLDAGNWIFINRSKTATACRIPLLPIPDSILKKYADNPITVTSGKLLPILSNPRMNSYLKELADICGIQKELTFHCARHTFATTVTLTNGVPLETVSKILGHKSLRTTQHYAKIVDKKVSEDMQFLKGRLAARKLDRNNVPVIIKDEGL